MRVLEQLPRSTRSRLSIKSRSARLRAALAAALLVAAVAPASADPPGDFPACTREPSQADLEGATGAHKAAKAYYERGDYDKAIERWREAYSFDCTKPAVFLNLGNAYEKKGDKASAITMFETYLVRAKDAPDAATIATKVNNLKTSLKSDPAPSSTATAPPPPTATSVGPAPTGTAGPDKPVPGTGERPFGVLPWIVVGAGGAALIGGVIVLVIGQTRISNAEALCGPSHNRCPLNPSPKEANTISDGESGQSMSTVGGIVMGIGGAAVLGGLAWQFLANAPRESAPQSSRAPLRVTPEIGRGHGGLVLSGAF